MFLTPFRENPKPQYTSVYPPHAAPNTQSTHAREDLPGAPPHSGVVSWTLVLFPVYATAAEPLSIVAAKRLPSLKPNSFLLSFVCAFFTLNRSFYP